MHSTLVLIINHVSIGCMDTQLIWVLWYISTESEKFRIILQARAFYGGGIIPKCADGWVPPIPPPFPIRTKTLTVAALIQNSALTFNPSPKPKNKFIFLIF